MKAYLFAGFVAGCIAVGGQSAPPHSVSSVEVEFEPSEGGAALTLPSFMVSELPVCYSSDSCALAVVPDPQNRGRQLSVMFDVTGRSRAVDPGAVENFSYVQVLNSAPTEDGVAVLVHAATSSEGAGTRMVPKGGAEPNRSKLHDGYFVCFFDHDGSPDGVYPVDARYEPAKIAYLGGDRLLMLLFDKVRGGPVMGIMTSDGQLVRFLDDQGALPSGDDLSKNSTLTLSANAPEAVKRIAMAGAMSAWQVGYAGNRLLFLQPGSTPTIFEVSPSGEIRKVRLKMPEGTTANSIISSDRGWLLRCFSDHSPNSGELLEFDREKGSVVRRIATKGTPPTSIFYADGGSYYASWWDKEHGRVFILKSK